MPVRTDSFLDDCPLLFPIGFHILRMESQARIAVVGMTTAYIQHGVYGRCVDSRDNHCLHAVLTLTRNDFFPVSRVRLFIQMYMGINHFSLRFDDLRSACEDGTVSIGEKTEIMAQGVVVYLFPVAIYKCADQ